MDKGTHSGSAPVLALDAFVRWLETDPPQSKYRDVLAILADKTRDALAKGDVAPVADVAQLARWHRDAFGGTAPTEPVTGKWLPANRMEAWRDARAASRRQYMAASGTGLDISVEVDQGGGRGNQTTYRLRVVELDASAAPAELALDSGLVPEVSARIPAAERHAPLRIAYQSEQARSALLVRPFFGKPFLVRSAKGTVFIGILILTFLTASLGGALCVWLVWVHGRPLPSWATTLTFVSTLAAFLTWAFKPLWQLSSHRVTIAPEWAVAFSQFYAQLQLTRAEDGDGRLGGRISLIRYFGSCPVCAGTVEIRDGGKAWPGRLVGCCSDNPREHVFSFDAVTLDGRLLIQR